MQLHRAALVFVVAVAALSACSSSSSASVISDVTKKLEDYANGARLVSGVTKEELIAAVDEWATLSDDLKARALQVPNYKLMFHFGIVPTQRIREQLDDIVIAIAHIHRLEAAYKRFRPAYMGKIIENHDLGNLKMAKMEDMFGKLKRRQLCTLKDFELIDMERKAWLSRLDDIVNHEDVYSNQDEMRNILNYLNTEMMKPLFDYVLPLLGQVKEPVRLQQLYYDKLYETTKIRFEADGKPVRDL